MEIMFSVQPSDESISYMSTLSENVSNLPLVFSIITNVDSENKFATLVCSLFLDSSRGIIIYLKGLLQSVRDSKHLLTFV